MEVVVIVTSVLLLLAVITLTVLLIVLWRSHAHLRKDTNRAVDRIYDDMDRAIDDLKMKQSQSITTKVVSAATVKIGDSSISHTAPKDEKLYPPPVTKQVTVVEKFESAPEDKWIHMTDAGGNNYHPGGLAAATAWLRDGMSMPSGTCIKEVGVPSAVGGGRICLGGNDGADALNIVGRRQAKQQAGPRLVRVQDALSFSADGNTVMAMMPSSNNNSDNENILTVSTAKAMQDGSYLTSEPSEMGHLMVAGGLNATKGVLIGSPDNFMTSSIISDASEYPLTVMIGAQGVWETNVDKGGSWNLIGFKKSVTDKMRTNVQVTAAENGVGIMLPVDAQPGEALDVNGNIRASGKLCIGATCLTSDDVAALKQIRTQPSPTKVATEVAEKAVDKHKQAMMQQYQQLQQQLVTNQQQHAQFQQQLLANQQQHTQFQQQLQGFGSSLKNDEMLRKQQYDQNLQQHTQFQQQLLANQQQHTQFQQQMQGMAPRPIFGSLSIVAVNAARVVFGMKLYVVNYVGPIIRVRRGSDNAVQDFYATPTGTIATAANGAGTQYSTWIGNSTGYVTTWYDQSGNGSHITQSVANRQPILTTAGKLVFNGSSQFLEKAYKSDVNTATFTYIVGCTSYLSGHNHQSPVTSSGTGDYSGYMLYKHPNPDNGFYHWNGAASGWQTIKSGVTGVPYTTYTIAGQYNGSNMTTVVNGSSASSTMQLKVNTTAPFRVGAGATESSSGNFFWNGEISTVMYFNASIPMEDLKRILASM